MPDQDLVAQPHTANQVNYTNWRALNVDHLVVGRMQAMPVHPRLARLLISAPGPKLGASVAAILSEKDRSAPLLREVRGWQETWRRGEPCPECGWPFPGAPYHLHDLSKTQREGPVRDD